MLAEPWQCVEGSVARWQRRAGTHMTVVLELMATLSPAERIQLLYIAGAVTEGGVAMPGRHEDAEGSSSLTLGLGGESL